MIIWLLLLLTGPAPAALPGSFTTEEACKAVGAALLPDLPHLCVKATRPIALA